MGTILRWSVVTGARLEDGDVVVSVRPYRKEALRCPVCGRCCSCHDHVPARRWRAMELASSRCYLK